MACFSVSSAVIRSIWNLPPSKIICGVKVTRTSAKCKKLRRHQLWGRWHLRRCRKASKAVPNLLLDLLRCVWRATYHWRKLTGWPLGPKKRNPQGGALSSADNLRTYYIPKVAEEVHGTVWIILYECRKNNEKLSIIVDEPTDQREKQILNILVRVGTKHYCWSLSFYTNPQITQTSRPLSMTLLKCV